MVQGRKIMERREMNKRINKVMYTTDGNVIRKINAVPEEIVTPKKKQVVTRLDKQEIRRQNRNYRKTYRENENAFTMSVPYVIFLTVAVIAVVVMCIQYLQLSAKVTDVKGNISNLESEFDSLKAQNDAIDYEINGFIDVDYIMKVATEELGMVNPSKNQIQYYDSSTSEYMKQYGDIPNND